MKPDELITILGGIIAAINAASLVYFAWKRYKPEVKRLEGEAESELQEATNLNLEGAKISSSMLLDRINELKGELETEKKLRKEGQAMAEKSHQESMQIMESNYKNAIAELERKRKEDREYFRRRIKELDKELRAYRTYAAKLSKQVIEAGKIPTALVFDYTDSNPAVQAVRPDLEEDLEEESKDGQ